MTVFVSQEPPLHSVVELSGGPLSGSRWPVRLESDRKLWFGIGTDGREFDGSSRPIAIAIYERTGGDASPRYNFSRLEGPETSIAELGRRITRLRGGWASQHFPGPLSADARVATEQPQTATTLARPDDASRIARRVVERWLSAVERSTARPRLSDSAVRVEMFVPGEASQLVELLQHHGIAAILIPTVTQLRRVGSEDCESINTGVVEFSPVDLTRVTDLLRSLSDG